MKKTWYQLPEKDCEYLKKHEFSAVRWCLAAVNSLAYGQEDLEKRLECIPQGKLRWRLMLGHLRALMNDILGTTPVKQCKTIKNEMEDMKLQLIPKTTVAKDRLVISVKDLSFIVDHAKQDMCTSCALMDNEFRKCEMFRILETVSPPKDMGDGTFCPYWKDDWWDK